ncbi:MAG: hypothetical protein GY950_01585 [bacterium]|nr:hypothetical protein [bacterium]
MQKALNFKFLADEGFSFHITSALRDRGYNVKWVGDFAAGVSDRTVYDLAQDDDRIILTEDKDFGELAVRYKLDALGVVLLRISSTEKELRIKRVIELLDRFPGKLEGHLVVIDPEKFRFRKL